MSNTNPMNPNPPNLPQQLPVSAGGTGAPPQPAPVYAATQPIAASAYAYRPAPKPVIVPLGENPEDCIPIPNVTTTIEAILRHPRRVMYQLHQRGASRLVWAMLFIAVLCSLIYGVVVGSFTGGTQLWAAPVKIAGGLLFSALICLPSLYIFACLGGSQARLREVCGLIAGLLMLTTILLIGFAPVAWLFSQSTTSAAFMGGLHLTFWLIATCFGLRFLENGFTHTKAKSMAGINAWIIIFVLVAMQMTTTLRPIIGKASTLLPTEKKSFVTYWGECLKAQ